MSATHALVLDDTAVARAELARSQYGAYPNAEELIRGQFASMSPELRAAVRKSENEDATAELKKSKKDNFGIEVPEGGKLRSCVVRGTDESSLAIVYVWEDKLGNLHRGMQGYTDKYEAPAESAQDRALREVAEHDGNKSVEALKANAEVEGKVAELREELSADLTKKFAELQDALVASLHEIAGSKPETPASSSAASGGGGGEVKYPRTHEALDALAQGRDDLPEDWDSDDMKVNDKVAWLKSKGITPQAEDEG